MDKSHTALWQSNYILLFFFHFDMETEGSIVRASDQTYFA